MKILLLGKRGQVGWELQRSLSTLGEIIAIDQEGAEGLSGDFSKPSQLVDTVRKISPAIIINAAAYTAVDKAESERELAALINSEAPGVLAEEAKRLGALLVHYSTDYIFDGSGSAARSETDPTSPINAYGASKLEGEKRIVASGCRHLTFRTSWVFASRGSNFIKTILRLAETRETLKVVGDQVGAPTGAELIADVTAQTLRHIASTGPSSERELLGTYNLTAGGETSWHAFACAIVAKALELGAQLALKPESIERITTKEYPTPAARPLNSRLSTQKLKTRFELELPHWQVGADRAISELLEGVKK